jgi:hypothetical protein
MALAFFVDLLMSTFLLAYLFARKPLGPVKWPWFLVLSLPGTLAFSIPLFIWLNWRGAPAPRASFAAADVLVCRLVAGKITYVHRRLWPAVHRLALAGASPAA